jgi:hypothetical protein
MAAFRLEASLWLGCSSYWEQGGNNLLNVTQNKVVTLSVLVHPLGILLP